MNSTRKNFLNSTLITSLIFFASFTKVSAQIITEPGVYLKYEDYAKHRLTKYDAITINLHGYKGVLNGVNVPIAEYKDVTCWGIQNENGVVYRINKKANIADQVISNGKVCYYAGMELAVTRNDDGSLKVIDIAADKGAKFSDLFWISAGGNGEMIPASEDNLTKLFAGAPDIIAKMKAKGIDETDRKKFIDDFTNVADWIREYDKTHK